MYFFKSVLDVADADPQDGQIVVRNITGRLFRVGTPGHLVQPNGLAVVSANDPIIQHNLKNNRIALVSESKSSSSTKKTRKKKSEPVVEVEQQEVADQQPAVEEVKVEEVVVSEPAAETAPVEVEEVAAETVATTDQPELTPNTDESSL
jgi:hypothetical protein